MRSRRSTIQCLSIVLCLFIFAGLASAQFAPQGAKLIGSADLGAARQGSSVALSADGNTAVVGAVNDNTGVGAVWIYTRSGGVWSEQTKLIGTGNAGSSNQGVSVAISADGNTVIVGGNVDNGYTGAAWVYTRSGSVWTQQGGKLVGTGAVGTSSQGYGVALSADGNTALVGGWSDNSFVGATWVYVRNAGVWSQQGAKLVGTGGIGAQQGVSVALSADGNTALVGGNGDSSYAGATWVFIRSGTVWTQQGGKLVGTGSGINGQQGYAVALSADGNTALVGGFGDAGNTGAAWFFSRTGSTWKQTGSKLTGSGATGNASIGWSVSLSADARTAVLGGESDNSYSGGAWVFTRNGSVWTQQGGKLTGAGGVGAAYFGQSVSVSGDGNTIFVGGNYDNGQEGAAWPFARDTKKIIAVSDIPGDQGGSVRVRWRGFLFDSAGVTPQVTSYGLWRKVRAGGASAALKRLLPPQPYQAAGDSLSQYDFLMSVPAVQAASYNAVVASLEDSSAGGTPFFSYLVTGHTSNAGVYYMSDPDSGYSVDNLAPIPPSGLAGTLQAGSQVNLSWDGPTDTDVRSYAVYRSQTGGFTPSPEDLIGSSSGTSFIDASPVPGEISYYRIAAVDVHDNPSLPSLEAPVEVAAAQQFSVMNLWNMVSVPCVVGDYAKTAVFPTATSSAYAFDNGYTAAGTLQHGRGYWLKFPGSQTVTINGLYRTRDTVAVAAGWNMVGSLSAPFPAASVTSIPGGMTTGSFYSFGVGYQASATIDPGRGYWVKVSQAGQLVFDSAPSADPANRIRIEDTGEMPPAPPGDDLRSEIPGAFALAQNYPNPFNPATRITYALPVGAYVTLKVYNALGQEVAVLVNEVQEAGYRAVALDASSLPSGMYTYRLTAGVFSEVRKMLLLK